MLHFLTRVAAIVVILAVPLRSSSAAPSFVGVGDLTGGSFRSGVGGISGDGSVVVGASESNLVQEAFRWTREHGIESLGVAARGDDLSAAGAVSYDGSVIVGRSGRVSGDFAAFRWTDANEMISIGDLPGGMTSASADAVSADGSVVVGTGTRSPTGGIEPFIWTETSGLVLLGALPAGATSGYADAISADGTVVAGGISRLFGIEGTRWTASTGIVPLGDLSSDQPPPGTNIYGMSADGRTLVGSSSGNGAVAWTEQGGWIKLGDASDLHSTAAFDADADGSTIVGNEVTLDPNDIFHAVIRATIWTSRDGNRLLQEVLTNVYGIDLTGWTLLSANAISDDGLTIAGNGINPLGFTEGWVAVIPEPSTALMVTLGLMTLSCRRPPLPRPQSDRST
jgi:probable HAF family extracellular repeat protein